MRQRARDRSRPACLGATSKTDRGAGVRWRAAMAMAWAVLCVVLLLGRGRTDEPNDILDRREWNFQLQTHQKSIR
jgi:hypothetical protein